jgi:S-(hydroxymethyl)glutathione dehydrogenase / alcohol dehydrogenase
MHDKVASKSSRLSRRRVLKTAGAAAVGSGAAALFGDRAAAAQGVAPAILANNQGGRRFRAFVKFNADRPTVEELRVRPLTGRQVLIRTEAAQTCYSSVDQVLIQGTPTNTPVIVGHGGVGVVEAVGPQAYRVVVGDRVIVNFHTACGSCFNCLWMRADKCLNRGAATAIPTCDLANGTPVFSGNSGMAELMIVHEEQAVPLFTDLPSVEIAMLSCVGNCGLGMAMTNCPVEAGSDVVIFGAGPVGLSSVQGARIKGASRIIVVEPIPYRRELAMKLGATAAVDPNQYRERQRLTGAAANGDQFRDSLVEHLREMTKKKTDRGFAGGGTVGPDHIMEAVGGDRVKPKTVQGPDPTGVTVLQECWELCSQIGTLVTCSVGHPAGAMVQISASQWADGAKHHWPGTAGGTNPRRDVPRYITMMETGQLNMKALASATYPLARAREAYQAAADREVVATIVTPT